ncbi:MAG: response receiver CheY associated with MCPs of class [Cyanobacteria bacterium RYN_339]|nr:response receiver CheY associated with MCPs of class [Cyanobacteria bacterium RYN_339]
MTQATILIVDDEPDIRMILETYLQAHGFQTLTAADGIEAVEVGTAQRPDLVLLDVMMPDMSGFQVARLLKDDPTTSAIPVIMLTAKTQQSDRFWGLDSGAVAYIHKPFDLQDVLDQVRLQLTPKP